MNEGDWHQPETQESITTSSDGVPEGNDHKMVVAPILSRRLADAHPLDGQSLEW